jgi:hypothetical protein
MRATEAQLASAKAQAAIMSKRVGRLLVIPPTSTSLIDEKSGEITGKYCGIFAEAQPGGALIPLVPAHQKGAPV